MSCGDGDRHFQTDDIQNYNMNKTLIIDSQTWTVEKLAKELSLSERMIRNHILSGNLDAEVLHCRYYFVRDEAIRKFIADYRRGAFPRGKHK
jgi:hypothetical protein